METESLNEVARRTRGGAGVKGGLSLELAVGHIGRMAERQARREDLMRLVHPVPITATQIPLAAGAGTLTSPDTLGPHEGYYWDVRLLVAQSFTGGTVTVFKSYQADENYRGSFPSAGLLAYGGNLLLNDSESLIFVASGIVGAVTISGEAYNVPAPLVPYYLL